MSPLEIQVSTAGEGMELETRGLRERLGAELVAVVTQDWAVDDARALLRLAAEESAAKPSVSDVWWSHAGFRMLRWKREGDRYRGEERDGAAFLPTIQRAAADWGAQAWVCDRYGAAPDRFGEDALIAVAAHVLRPGTLVEGTRYAMSGDNAGWILVDDRFTGGVDDLHVEHASHVADARPDLVRYFGLPVGWRFFRTADGEHVGPSPRSSRSP